MSKFAEWWVKRGRRRRTDATDRRTELPLRARQHCAEQYYWQPRRANSYQNHTPEREAAAPSCNELFAAPGRTSSGIVDFLGISSSKKQPSKVPLIDLTEEAQEEEATEDDDRVVYVVSEDDEESGAEAEAETGRFAERFRPMPALDRSVESMDQTPNEHCDADIFLCAGTLSEFSRCTHVPYFPSGI